MKRMNLKLLLVCMAFASNAYATKMESKIVVEFDPAIAKVSSQKSSTELLIEPITHEGFRVRNACKEHVSLPDTYHYVFNISAVNDPLIASQIQGLAPYRTPFRGDVRNYDISNQNIHCDITNYPDLIIGHKAFLKIHNIGYSIESDRQFWDGTIGSTKSQTAIKLMPGNKYAPTAAFLNDNLPPQVAEIFSSVRNNLPPQLAEIAQESNTSCAISSIKIEPAINASIADKLLLTGVKALVEFAQPFSVDLSVKDGKVTFQTNGLYKF